MRAVAWIRNYALFVFFLPLVGGVVLKPGTPAGADAPSAAATSTVAQPA
jgi:hypothetical protein